VVGEARLRRKLAEAIEVMRSRQRAENDERRKTLLSHSVVSTGRVDETLGHALAKVDTLGTGRRRMQSMHAHLKVRMRNKKV
jgi:hypothetical protein